jgi:hypothetical protein
LIIYGSQMEHMLVKELAYNCDDRAKDVHVAELAVV